MKKSMRLICLTLAFVLCLTLLFGCGKKNGTSGTSSQGGSTGSDVPAVDQMLLDNEIIGSWSTDRTPYDLEWYMGFPTYQFEWNSEKLPVHQIHKYNTGLNHIEFIIAASAENEKLSAMIVAGTLPDVITLNAKDSAGGLLVDMLKKGDLIYDLKALSEQYAPDFMEGITESIYNWYKDEDGSYYGFTCLTKPPELVTENFNKRSGATNLLTIARKDFMDQLGLKPEDFATQDKMVESLKKVRDAKLKQDGMDVTPFLLSNDLNMAGIEWLAQFFGLSYEDKDGNYIMPLRNSKFLEMILFLNRLYREGFYTDQNMIMSLQNHSEELANGTVFMMMGNCNLGGPPGTGMRSFYLQTEGKSEYIGIVPPSSKDGAFPYQRRNDLGGWMTTFITKKDKAPAERIIQLFAYLHTPKVQLMDTYGVEGLTYHMVDGYVLHTDEAIASRKEDITGSNRVYGYPDIMWAFRDSLVNQYMPYPTEPEEIMLENIKMIYSGHAYSADALTLVVPTGNRELGTINAKVAMLMNAEIPKIILADSESECRAMFEATMKNVEEMGYQTLFEAYNEMFKNAKKRAGQEFIYPTNIR